VPAVTLSNKKEEESTKVDDALESRIKRGRERLQRVSSERDVAWEFFRGNHFAYVDDKNKVQFQPTVTTVRGSGKPRWKSRQKRNLIYDAVLFETSAATQRAPSYQVVPSTEDPEDRSAAGISEKVLRYGHGKWSVRKAAYSVVMHAIIAGEGFAWPFFDNTIGPFIAESDEKNAKHVGQGDIRVKVFGANECFWEPGLRFEDSPWHAVEQARPISEVEQMDGFLLKPNTLTPDASQRSLAGRGQAQGERKLVLVTDYLERPSPRSPRGRWVTMANNRRIVADRGYPSETGDPVLRKLSYAPDPDNDRDLGLVGQLIDAQRTHNDATNKQVEWKNLALMPQFVVSPGLMKQQRRTDEPGKVYEIPDPERNVKVIPVPNVPRELFEMADRAERDIGRIAAQNDIPSQVESGRGIQALLEKDSSRRAAFIAGVAEWYSQIGHDCLYLVQAHYTEERVLHIRGDFGWESIDGFKGADLKDQIDVRVFPDSIEPLTRQAVEQRMMNYAQLGWIGPEQAMTAIESGTAEALMSQLLRDEARAGRIIQKIKAGMEALQQMPTLPTGRMEKTQALDPAGQPAFDEVTGEPVMVDSDQPEMAPAWMPRYSDNLKVFRTTFEDWMKTEEFENLEEDQQLVTANIYQGIIMLEAEKAAEQAQAQSAQAAQMGMENAASPQAKPLPSLPSIPDGAPQPL
jgi:hypothetical protein